MDPKIKRLDTGRTCRPTQRGEKNSVWPLGLYAAVFYARGAKWTTFLGVTAADGLLFLAPGPHFLIFFYTMDPKRKRLETGPHLGPHNGPTAALIFFLYKKKKGVDRQEMDANGNPIRAKTVSTDYKGKRENIRQMPETKTHVTTPVFVRDIYGKNKNKPK